MRHVRQHRLRPASSRARRLGATLVLLTSGALVPLAASTPSAHAAAACVTPEVRDIMISQGLPSYKRLVRGKTTLARYFLSAPSCAPAGATIRVVKGSLDLARKADGVRLATVPLVATLPLPPVGPSSSSPVLAAASDPMFTVPGSTLDTVDDTATTLVFSATFDFESTYANGTKETGTIVIASRPGGAPVESVLEKRSHPLRVLAVPMGDAGTAAVPTTYTTQFPDTARSELANGMSAVGRSLPVADGVSDLLIPSGGLRYSVNAGMVNLNRYMPNGIYCGTGAEFSAVEQELALMRTNWNSQNPAAYADLAYGAIWQGVSAGATTGGAATCADGYARVGGKASWGRVVAATSTRPGVTGSLATMELMHNTGAVGSSDTRYDGGYHSKNAQADVTAPERAWNTTTRTWLSQDRSALQFATSGWNEGNTLLEKEEFDRLSCQLTPGSNAATCPNPGAVGVAAASAVEGASFFVTGVTDGTPAGTEVHTYLDDDSNYEAPEPGSAYRFVQRNAAGQIVADDGLPVRFEDSHHHGPTQGPGASTHSATGVFGVELRAAPDATRIQVYKGDPRAAGVLLHDRLRNAPPTFLGASVERRTVTVSATDELPQDLRLDLFLRCPQGTSPLANAVEPTVVGRTAVFLTSFDTSLGCPEGTLLYRVTDGYLVTSQEEPNEIVTSITGTAAISAPTPDARPTVGRLLALSGSVRDAADRPADELTWSISGPSFPQEKPVATGPAATYLLPKDLTPGVYTLRLTGRSGTPLAQVATTTRVLTVLADKDLDDIPDEGEGPDKPCYGPNAVNDPSNAAQDSDNDGLANVNDPAPCTSTSNIGVTFSPTSLQKASSGVPVTIELSASPVDLRTLTAAELQIVQVAGYRLTTPLVASGFTPTSATTGTVKFDRGPLNELLRQNELLGYTPIFVAAPSRGVRGVDPVAPRVFP